MAITAISMSAQNDVTTFLGIPVDGFKSDMKQKLVKKGFVPKKVGTNEFWKENSMEQMFKFSLQQTTTKCIESCCAMQKLEMRRI